MGWPLNTNFVFYKVVFLFHSYKATNSIDNLFAGFQSTKDSKVLADYTVDPSSLEILSRSQEGKVSYFYLPFEHNGQFKDQRIYVSEGSQLTSAEDTIKVSGSSNFTPLLVGLGFLLIAELVFIIYRNMMIRKRREAGNNRPIHVPEIFVSYHQSPQEREERVEKPMEEQ